MKRDILSCIWSAREFEQQHISGHERLKIVGYDSSDQEMVGVVASDQRQIIGLCIITAFPPTDKKQKSIKKILFRKDKLKGWLKFTREHCSICDKTGGCMINEKGDTILCTRVESNIVFSKTFQSWVHKLSDTKEIKVIKNNVHERTKAPICTLDKFLDS